MKRQAVVKRIERKLKILEGCRLGYNEASEILKIVEDCYLPLRNEWDLMKRKTK